MPDKVYHWRHVITLMVIVIAALVAHHETLGWALLGSDAYPLIIASRIQDFSDFLGTFTEVMMDGRFRLGTFYRPVANLSLAVDYAIWGLHPFGYHLTGLTLHGLIVALIYLFLRKTLGSQSWLGPAFAALFYALHPSVLAVLPFPARRCEMLMLLFTLASLIILPVRPKRRMWRRYMAAGLFAMLAMGSKESGLIAIGLIFLHQLLFGFTGRHGPTARRAIQATVPAVLMVSLFIAARFAVIGGPGGYHLAQSQSYTEKLIAFTPAYVSSTLCSLPLVDSQLRTCATVSVAAVLGVLVIWCAVAAAGAHHETWQRAARLIVVAAVWLAVNLLVSGLSSHFAPNYVMLLSVNTAILLGALAEVTILVLRPPRASRYCAALPASGVLLAFVCALYRSPLHSSYPEFRVATTTETRTLRLLEQRLRAASGGVRFRQRITPVVSYDRGRVKVWMLMPWSVQAWVDLKFPHRDIAVHVESMQWDDRKMLSGITLWFIVRNGEPRKY